MQENFAIAGDLPIPYVSHHRRERFARLASASIAALAFPERAIDQVSLLTILFLFFLTRLLTVGCCRNRATVLIRGDTMSMIRLKKMRRDCGISQHELAHKTGIARWKIVFAETGRIHLNPAELQTIKNVLAKRAAEALASIQAAE